LNIEGLHLNQSAWLTSDSEVDIPFSSITEHFSSLKQTDKNTSAIYFSSTIDNHSLPLLLAAWLKGSALVPVSENQPEHLKKLLLEKTKAVSISNIIDNQYFNSENTISRDEKRTACFIQTSGSSGTPKIVSISQKMILVASETVEHWIKPVINDTWLLTLPLHHIGGLSILFRSILSQFSVYYKPRLRLELVGKLIESGKVQFVSLVPTQLKRLLDLGTRPHSKFKKILLGGGPSSVQLLQNAVDAGFTIVNSFGMTETAAQFTGIEYKQGQKIHTSEVGTCISPNQIKLIPEDESDRAENTGVLWVKGPQVITEYPFGDEQSSFSQSWFCTGDYGKMNSSGNLEILMRRTDRIVSGGENINPNEIELIINEFPGITDCAVLGIPDEEWGQKLILLYVGSAQTAVLKAILLDKLERFKIPKEFVNVTEIPRISISKINRRALNDLYNQTIQKNNSF